MSNMIELLIANGFTFIGAMEVFLYSLHIYTKYKVNRLNKYANYSIKEKPKSLIRANQEKIKNRYNNYPDEVKNYIEKVSRIATKEELEQIKRNLETLNIYKNIKNINLILKLYGYYDGNNHSININQYVNKRRSLSTMNHELTHAISSGGEYKDTFFVGFHQGTNDVLIGRGLNEGYTEYFNQKYITKGQNKNYSYKYHVQVAKILEFIIGEEKIKSLYLNSNLKGLVKQLEQYINKEKIINFIINLDKILLIQNQLNTTYILSLEEKQKLLNLYNEITIFLYKVYSNKKQDNYFSSSNNFLELLDELDKVSYFETKPKEIIEEIKQSIKK